MMAPSRVDRRPMAALIRAARSIAPLRRWFLRRRSAGALRDALSHGPVGCGRKALVINHHFDQDIEALLLSCHDSLEFLVLPCMPFFAEALLFFRTPEQQDGIVPYSQLPRALVEGYRAICRRLFDMLHASFPFELIVMPSDSFWWVREFLVVAAERGVARVVLDKEGTISPMSFDLHARQIRTRYPFMSDRLLVWSERQREFWLRAGAPEACIRVVGQPRSDYFFQPARWRSRRDLGLPEARRVIAFFTFDVDAYINLFTPEEVERDQLTWGTLRSEIHDELIRIARRHPDVHVVVKAHPQQADLDEVRLWFESLGLPNVVVMDGAGISNHVIVNADLIIGFQTTALTDAMLTDKPVLYTAWGPTEERVRDLILPFHRTRGLEWITSAAHLRATLEAWISAPNVSTAIGGNRRCRKEFTDYFLLADGHVGERLRDALSNIGVERTHGEGG